MSDEIHYSLSQFDFQRAESKNLVSMHRMFNLHALNILYTSVRLKVDDAESQYFLDRLN